MDLFDLVLTAKLTKGGGGGDIEVEALNVTENGTYSASSGYAFDPVTVSVPQSGITPTGTSEITANGIYDITNYASASVSVPVGVFPSGIFSIASNGIYDITNYASADVNVSGGGGGSNIVQGTFTTNDSTGIQTINVPYNGSGYPIKIGICVSAGTKDNDSDAGKLVHNYGIVEYIVSKCKIGTAPSYTGSSSDAASTYYNYKSSSSEPYSYTLQGQSSVNTVFAQTDPSTTQWRCVKMPDAKTLKIIISAAGTQGFLPNIEYSYYVMYSS